MSAGHNPSPIRRVHMRDLKRVYAVGERVEIRVEQAAAGDHVTGWYLGTVRSISAPGDYIVDLDRGDAFVAMPAHGEIRPAAEVA